MQDCFGGVHGYDDPVSETSLASLCHDETLLSVSQASAPPRREGMSKMILEGVIILNSTAKQCCTHGVPFGELCNYCVQQHAAQMSASYAARSNR